ncbi:PREDICTED: mitochondrial import inner membrane translocase subunit Tim13-B-like [Ceratosolen solmsi marchali]|uniref:Mitochondrial import inner membrane translocase subunit n=1 Tax=Ceratosolen solmsi marchali TaxID=326594 RepID=A0AAJ6YL19_9HYME|nr:PREDICTED: mitochondrial import inner membrane translocase subunit Tim13-B-like [Ceratosolen solmsi marchali]
MDSLGDDSPLTSSQKDDLMEKIKQEIALANFQELLSKITDKCFKFCIQKPGTSLDNSEQKCVAMCMDRYLDSYNIVLKAYTNRIQKERIEK